MSFSTSLFNLRALSAGLGLALAAFSAQAQTQTSRYPHASFGLALGYGAPYGWGADLSLMVVPNLDVNVGLGASITGGKVGVGTRYYFSPERKVSAFVGGNLVYSTGFNHLTITNSQRSIGGTYYTSSNNDVVVNFKSTSLLHLRGGVRWQPTRRFGLIGAIGYGVVLGGDPVEYVGGNYSQSNQNLVKLFSPGGVELSVGVAFGIGRRD